MDSDNIDRFMRLFRGNVRSFGQYVPSTRKSFTEKRQYSFGDFKKHFDGSMGIGIGPILDDSTCYFGAIDLDAHGDCESIDLFELERSVRENDYPLTVCRSKSGGAHLYLFCGEATKASLVRDVLGKWAKNLGHGGAEVFPKQQKLYVDDEGNRGLASYINLPYFADFKGYDNQQRYCFEGGKQIPFDRFLDVAEERRISGSLLVEKLEDDHRHAPPCIQKMISNGVGSGHRNEAMYNLVIYLKQAYPETWRDKAFDFNASMFDRPLPYSEAKKTISSAGRREYKYKCGEEPCKSLCDSSKCVDRKFGITKEEQGVLTLGEMPTFSSLKKYLTDPVKWELLVDGSPIVVTTGHLMDFRLVRSSVAESLTKLIPNMKNDKWAQILAPLMERAELVEAPDEASTGGIVRAKLVEFAQKADLKSDGKDVSKRKELLLGSPVVQLHPSTGERVVFFRAASFVDFLKKTKSEELKGSNLWMELTKMGVGHGTLRVGKKVISVWNVAVSDDQVLGLGKLEVDNEF